MFSGSYDSHQCNAIVLNPDNPVDASLLAKLRADTEIEFIDTLPKTRSGKIMRRLLKARELGLPEGDTSTLED